jgi:hypothetical protein
MQGLTNMYGTEQCFLWVGAAGDANAVDDLIVEGAALVRFKPTSSRTGKVAWVTSVRVGDLDRSR